MLADGVSPSPSPTISTPAPVFAPVGTPSPTPVAKTPEQLFSAKEIGTIGTVTVTADLFDPRSADDNGCDPSGCTADLTRVRDSMERLSAVLYPFILSSGLPRDLQRAGVFP